MTEIVTLNLSKFGYRELKLAEELLKAWREQGLPNDFYNEDVTINLNLHSGYVFLSNSEYQVAMMNGDNLESFYHDISYTNQWMGRLSKTKSESINTIVSLRTAITSTSPTIAYCTWNGQKLR